MALLSPADRLRVRLRRLRTVYRRPLATLDDLGHQLGFYGRALAWTPRTLRRYKKETMRLLAEVTFGSGALAVIGGTVGVIAFLSFFTGTEVGLQGYAALDQLGTSAFTGFLSAYFNTREIAPLVAEVVEDLQRLAADALEPAELQADAVRGREQGGHHCPFGGTSWK